jgi:hypothetical protein
MCSVLTPGGAITIVKDSIPDDAQDFPFGVLLPGQILFSLDDDADATLPDRRVFLLAPGEYFAFESIGGGAGWTLDSRVCDDAGSSTVEAGFLSGIGVAIDLDAGEDIMCTFTNTQAEQIRVGNDRPGGTAIRSVRLAPAAGNASAQHHRGLMRSAVARRRGPVVAF